MSHSDFPPDETPAQRIQRRREMLRQIRERARKLFQEGVLGLQVASLLSDSMDQFAVSIVDETIAEFSESERKQIRENASLVAVGGTGRGEVAPFSDFDLVIVYRSRIDHLVSQFSKLIVPAFFDAGIELGQRVFTIYAALEAALVDPHLSTSLVYARGLWGDELLTTQLIERFYRRVVRRRLRGFVEDCIQARQDERVKFGATGQQLEPNVKRSLGGLRDFHLLQWVGYAHYETSSIETLRLRDALTANDAMRLKNAVEFLTKVRLDLHLHSNRENDTLSKDDQLRITESRQIVASEGQLAVEIFMQEFFLHSMAIADISRRFVARHRRHSLFDWFRRRLFRQRLGRQFLLSPTELDVRASKVSKVCETLDDILRIFHAAAMYRVRLSATLTDAIQQRALTLEPGPSAEASRLFMEILDTTGRLADTIRCMHETNVLELVIPEWKRVRCLMQFNHYHHYTVDEHTLLAIQICEGFASEDSPHGAAYRALNAKSLLHLAILLHDAGKGYVEDHCEVGQRLAIDVCQRLGLPSSQSEIVSFLIHKHLQMADVGLRRDTTDGRLLLEFSHKLGTPEKASMLFILTCADISAVGPGVWTRWKGDLLAEFFNRLNFILSGQHPKFHEEERLRQIREYVYQSISPLEAKGDREEFKRWVDEQLESFSSHYLTTTAPPRIAADLDTIRRLKPGEICVDGRYEPETKSVALRVILDATDIPGCFHQIAGVLTAKHLDILGAGITTNRENIVVDVFHVLDDDFSGPIPQDRINEIGTAIRDTLKRQTTVENLFRRHKRFVSQTRKTETVQLETRAMIDNDTSDRCTVISVFAHDRPGLLYTITRTLFQLGLSVELAMIGSHFHQVVDVFYVTDNAGQKIDAEAFQIEIQQRLLKDLAAFESLGHNEFISG